MTDQAPATERSHNLAKLVERFGIIGVVVLMMIFLYALQPEYFLTFANLTNILKQISNNALLSIGMFVVILTAGIDLSVGSVMALAMMSLALANADGWPWIIVLLVGPVVGALSGLVNGLGLTVLRLPHPFIMTLGTPVRRPRPHQPHLRRRADLRPLRSGPLSSAPPRFRSPGSTRPWASRSAPSSC